VTTYTIDVAGSAAANYPANNWTGFTSPATTIHTVLGVNRLVTNPPGSAILAQTVATSRDQEVTSFFSNGAILLRLDGTHALYYWSQTSGSNQVRIGYVKNYNPSNFFAGGSGGTFYDFLNTNSPGTDLPGWSTLTTSDTITFGCSAFDIYLKFNGVEVFRYKQRTHMAVGSAGIWNADSNGVTNVNATTLATASIFSNPATFTYDMRDFGFRQLTHPTSTTISSPTPVTGSITGGTNSLVLSASQGFVVGDQVIIQIGAEAGAGAQGTIGVGGQWPPLTYATTAALLADNTKASGTYAGAIDTGFVYVWNGSTWVRNTTNGSQAHFLTYYDNLINPHALNSTVTAVSGDGLTITLKDNASATATNANIYLNCHNYLVNFWARPTSGGGLAGVPYQLSPSQHGETVSIPVGSYALCGTLGSSTSINIGSSGYNWTNLTVSGDSGLGTFLFLPYGSQSSFEFALNNTTTVNNINMQGNHGPSKYGWSGWADDNSGGGSHGSNGAINFTGNPNNSVSNLHFSNTFGPAVEFSQGCNNSFASGCSLIMDYAQHNYNGWAMQVATSTGGGFTDCTVTSNFLIKAFEMFEATSTVMTRCNGTNAIYASNSCTNSTWKNCTSTITANSWVTSSVTDIGDAVYQINSQQDQIGKSGNSVVNCNVIQTGYVDGTNSLPHITIDSFQINTTVSGGYPACPVGSNYGGYFEAPDWKVGSSQFGSTILVQGPNATINGVRIVGKAVAKGVLGTTNQYGNISFKISGSNPRAPAGSIAENNVADVITNEGGLIAWNNQHNSAYALACGAVPSFHDPFIATRGYGTGTLKGTIALVTLRGYGFVPPPPPPPPPPLRAKTMQTTITGGKALAQVIGGNALAQIQSGKAKVDVTDP